VIGVGIVDTAEAVLYYVLIATTPLVLVSALMLIAWGIGTPTLFSILFASGIAQTVSIVFYTSLVVVRRCGVGMWWCIATVVLLYPTPWSLGMSLFFNYYAHNTALATLMLTSWLTLTLSVIYATRKIKGRKAPSMLLVFVIIAFILTLIEGVFTYHL
jgi:hypothetical protein